MFHMDVAMVVSQCCTYCNGYTCMLQEFIQNVSSVFRRMLQVFYLDVAYVVMVMLQMYVPNVSYV